MNNEKFLTEYLGKNKYIKKVEFFVKGERFMIASTLVYRSKDAKNYYFLSGDDLVIELQVETIENFYIMKDGIVVVCSNNLHLLIR